jgi:hypothetical protein
MFTQTEGERWSGHPAFAKLEAPALPAQLCANLAADGSCGKYRGDT